MKIPLFFFQQLDKEGSLTAEELANVAKLSVMLARERYACARSTCSVGTNETTRSHKGFETYH